MSVDPLFKRIDDAHGRVCTHFGKTRMSGWAFQRAELKPSRTNPSSDPDPEFETIEIELIEYDPQSPQQIMVDNDLLKFLERQEEGQR